MTPGQDRVLRVSVRGYVFGYRRPSRADLSDIARRYALKVAPVTGLPVEADTIAQMAGDALHREAELEVLLVPRRRRNNESMPLGETAPAHWLDGEAISFDHVDPDEFDEVVEAIRKALAEAKNAPPPGSSSSSAGGQTSG